jgi:hypothetical protein
MQFRHPESYRIMSDGRILQDPMGSGVGYVDLGGTIITTKTSYFYKTLKNLLWAEITIRNSIQ